MRETAPMEPSALDEPSRHLLEVLASHPMKGPATFLMERLSEGGWSLFVRIPSPTADRRRDLSIWLDERRIPTLQFGAWHTHADRCGSAPDAGSRHMLEYLDRIIDGEVVLAGAPTVGDAMPFRVIDVRDELEVLDELTSPDVPADLKLLSWSGEEDAPLSDLRESVEELPDADDHP